MKIIYAENAPEPIGPYSQATLVNGLLFISGQVAINRQTGEFETSDIQSETDRVMKNLEAILNAAGVNFSHVVKCTLFIRDMNDFVKINEVYGSYFASHPPARETVEVSGLPKNCNIEISCIAYVPK